MLVADFGCIRSLEAVFSEKKGTVSDTHTQKVLREWNMEGTYTHFSRSWFRASSVIILNKNQPDAH
jgi:hypothetical protein